jgi:hypothetical protein
MDKAKAMRHQACLPQSWWEFAVEQAVHLYNWTPIKRLGWCTPYELLYHSAPDISHFRVFGCSTYVYLHPDVRQNKLAPKSELMVYIGLAQGIKGYCFMHLKTNQIYIGTTALFDESFFPKCSTQKCHGTTCIDEPESAQPPL